MKARELMKFAPGLDLLLDRCISTDYELDEHDFFYMQGLSERFNFRFPNGPFPNERGHWYGPSTCVAGGYIHRKFREAGYDNLLEKHRAFLRLSIDREISVEKGNKLQSPEEVVRQRFALIKDMKDMQPTLTDITDSVNRTWVDLAEKFLGNCDLAYQNWQWILENPFDSPLDSLKGIYGEVDFSTPALSETKLFLPFKEIRRFTQQEIDRLHSSARHDVFPIGMRLSSYR